MSSNHHTGFKDSLTISKVLVNCNNHSSQLKRVSSIRSCAFLCSISDLFFFPETPGLIQFSCAELPEFQKYDSKNNGLPVQRNSLCLTSTERGKPSLMFTFAFHLPNCFSFKVLHYSALVLSIRIWYLILLLLILPLPVPPSLPLHDSIGQWPSLAAWVL